MQHEAVRRGLEMAGFEEVDVSTEEPVPAAALELDVYPNPAAAEVQVAYSLEREGRIDLSIYDVLGRRVVRLVEGPKVRGAYRAAADLSHLSSGIYFVLLRTPAGSITRALSVVR